MPLHGCYGWFLLVHAICGGLSGSSGGRAQQRVSGRAASSLLSACASQVYNAVCVALAGYVVVGVVRYKLEKPGSFACNAPDLSPAGHRLAQVMWCATLPLLALEQNICHTGRSGSSAPRCFRVRGSACAELKLSAEPFGALCRVYYAQKFLEFGDTMLFVLRMRFRQLTGLHVYHHVSITVVTALFLRYDVAGDSYLAALANSCVHVLMYSHYLLSAFGVDTWWRKQLTTLQLIQFLLVMAQSLLAAARGPACGFPHWLKALMVAYQITMLALFGAFFVSSYLLGHKSKKGAKAKAT